MAFVHQWLLQMPTKESLCRPFKFFHVLKHFREQHKCSVILHMAVSYKVDVIPFGGHFAELVRLAYLKRTSEIAQIKQVLSYVTSLIVLGLLSCIAKHSDLSRRSKTC
jgi:hypothetical protein